MGFWDKAKALGNKVANFLFGSPKAEPTPQPTARRDGPQITVTTNTGMQPTAPVPSPAQVFKKADESFTNNKVAEPCKECDEAVEREKNKTGDWRVAHSLVYLRAQINKKFPNRNKASDGTIGDTDHKNRNSDHNPWVQDGKQGVVTALDITHDPKNGCDAGAIANALVNSRDPRLKYVIFNRRIAVAPTWTWGPYKHADTMPHTQHVHISVNENKSQYDSQAPWPI